MPPFACVAVPGSGADSDDLYIADTQNNTIWLLQQSSTCTGVGSGSNPCNMQVRGGPGWGGGDQHCTPGERG